VTISKHQIGLIPVADYKIKAQRIICYNIKMKKLFPIKAVGVMNITESTLEGGNCILLEDSKYIGESFILNVKPDEPQFVSYTVEKNVLVRKESKTDHKIPHQIKFLNNIKKNYVNKFSQADTLSLLKKIVFN
jgi:hypothetical protein